MNILSVGVISKTKGEGRLVVLHGPNGETAAFWTGAKCVTEEQDGFLSIFLGDDWDIELCHPKRGYHLKGQVTNPESIAKIFHNEEQELKLAKQEALDLLKPAS